MRTEADGVADEGMASAEGRRETASSAVERAVTAVAVRLRVARTRRGMTLSEVAAQTGFSKTLSPV